MGGNRQICWDKFCTYGEVEPRFVPLGPDRWHLEPAAASWRRTRRRSGGGTSAWRGWSRSMPAATNTAASCPGWAGCPGARTPCCPRSGASMSTISGGVTPAIGMNVLRPGAPVVAPSFNVLHRGRRGYGERMASREAIACHRADRLAEVPPPRLVSHPLGPLPVFCLELEPLARLWSGFHLSDKLRELGWLQPPHGRSTGRRHRAGWGLVRIAQAAAAGADDPQLVCPSLRTPHGRTPTPLRFSPAGPRR